MYDGMSRTRLLRHVQLCIQECHSMASASAHSKLHVIKTMLLSLSASGSTFVNAYPSEPDVSPSSVS
jgi:hypothetical protein